MQWNGISLVKSRDHAQIPHFQSKWKSLSFTSKTSATDGHDIAIAKSWWLPITRLSFCAYSHTFTSSCSWNRDPLFTFHMSSRKRSNLDATLYPFTPIHRATAGTAVSIHRRIPPLPPIGPQQPHRRSSKASSCPGIFTCLPPHYPHQPSLEYLQGRRQLTSPKQSIAALQSWVPTTLHYDFVKQINQIHPNSIHTCRNRQSTTVHQFSTDTLYHLQQTVSSFCQTRCSSLTLPRFQCEYKIC